MNTYFALFLIATFTALTITPLIRRLCERFSLLDVPLDGRRVHDKAVPRLGGVAVYLSCLVALSALPFVDNLLTQSLRGYTSDIFVTLVPATMVLMLGVYDDLRGTNATVKFVALGLISTLFYAMGGRIAGISIPFLGSFYLPGTLSFMVTVVWLVGIANAFNLIDGMDGLASGAALFSSMVILLVSLAQAQPLMIVVALVLCGALAGFLRYNFNPASIFLGDSGALFIGFTLAALSVLCVQKATTAVAVVIPILAFGLPVVDTAVTMGRRLISRKPIFKGDDEHIHHMLLARGWSQRHVVLVLYGVCAIFGLLAAIFTNTSSPVTGFVLFVVAIAVIIAVGQLRYHEVEEIRAGVKRTVGDRRARMANNISVRRASLSFSNASNLDDLFEALEEMLECGQFVYANAQLGQQGHAEVNERAFTASRHRLQRRTIEMRSGRIYWAWDAAGVGTNEIIGSKAYWSLRLPLASASTDLGWLNLYRPIGSEAFLLDMSYLSSHFQRELADAIARILKSYEAADVHGDLVLGVSAGKITG